MNALRKQPVAKTPASMSPHPADEEASNRVLGQTLVESMLAEQNKNITIEDNAASVDVVDKNIKAPAERSTSNLEGESTRQPFLGPLSPGKNQYESMYPGSKNETIQIELAHQSNVDRQSVDKKAFQSLENTQTFGQKMKKQARATTAHGQPKNLSTKAGTIESREIVPFTGSPIVVSKDYNMQQAIFAKRASTKDPRPNAKSFSTCQSNLGNTTTLDPEKLMTLQEGKAKKNDALSLQTGAKQSYVSSTANLRPDLLPDQLENYVSCNPIQVSRQSRQRSEGLSKEFKQFTSQYGIPIIQKQNKDMRVEEYPVEPLKLKDSDAPQDGDVGSMVSASTKDLRQEGRQLQNVSGRPGSQLRPTSRNGLSKQETRPNILSSQYSTVDIKKSNRVKSGFDSKLRQKQRQETDY